MGENLRRLRFEEDPIVADAAKEVLEDEYALMNHNNYQLEKLHRLFREQGLYDAALIVEGALYALKKAHC